MGYQVAWLSGRTLEIYKYQHDLPPHITNSARIANRTRKRSNKRNSRVSRRRVDNVWRLRKKFQRLILANLVGKEKPALFSLTCAQNTGIKLGYSYLTDFIRRLRRVHGLLFRYIAVPEFQKRGSVHFHMLLWGLSQYVDSVETNKELSPDDFPETNFRQFQCLWGRGFLDCILTDGSPKLSTYLSKYMSKAMQDDRLLGQKAYVASRNVLRPMSAKTAFSVALTEEAWPVDNADIVIEKKFDTMWLGSCNYKKIIFKS